MFLGYLLITNVLGVRQSIAQYGSAAPKSPLYGIWDVEEFTRDGRTLPPILTEQTRWRKFITQQPSRISWRDMDDSPHSYEVRFDLSRSTIYGTDPKTSLTLAWTRPDADHLTLEGTVEGHQMSTSLKRIDDRKMNLWGRGFHWVSERPFNR